MAPIINTHPKNSYIQWVPETTLTSDYLDTYENAVISKLIVAK